MPRPSILACLMLVILAAMFALVIGGKPDPVLLNNPLVKSSLQPIGVADPNWQTLVVLASRDVDLPRAQVYGTWEKLENWNRWGKPLIVNARWIDTPGWRQGARFEQTLDLGFPLGETHSNETVATVMPGKLVSWLKTEGSIRSNHVWSFEDLPNGGTRVVNLEIFHGLPAGFGRAIFEERWQRRFDEALDGLILQARHSKP